MGIALTLLVMVSTLWLLGRRWWCACGRPNIWTSAVTSSCNSQHLFDPYSLTHFQHGLILTGAAWLVGIPLAWSLTAVLAVEAGWEVFENTTPVIEFYRRETISRGYVGDSIINSLGDLACCAVGAVFAGCEAWWFSGFVVVMVDIMLWSSIGDCLTLNVYKGIKATARWLNSRLRR